MVTHCDDGKKKDERLATRRWLRTWMMGHRKKEIKRRKLDYDWLHSTP